MKTAPYLKHKHCISVKQFQISVENNVFFLKRRSISHEPPTILHINIRNEPVWYLQCRNAINA